MKLEITPDIANRLGCYVYLYIDPRNAQVFYVGKGVGNRATAHFDATGETRRVQRIPSRDP